MRNKQAKRLVHDNYVREIVERLVNGLRKVDAIILFGSRARGDWVPWSDYDILVIAEFQEKYLDRIARILGLLSDLPVEVEPHPYTLEEAIQMLLQGNPTIVDAIEEGVILYQSPRLKTLLDTYMELKKRGLSRSKTSIILPR